MPAQEFESFLQGARGGQQYEDTLLRGKQQMALEDMLHHEDIPQQGMHPAMAQFSSGPGRTPGTLRFNTAVIGDARQAAEAAMGRENRVSQAQSMIAGLKASAPNGDISQLPRPHQQVIATLSRAIQDGVRDIDPKVLEAGNSLLAPKVIMGKPLETPIDEVTGKPVAASLPMPDVSATLSGDGGGTDYRPPQVQVGSSGVSVTQSPYSDNTIIVQRAVASERNADGSQKFPPGTQAYKLEVERRMPAAYAPAGPDQQLLLRRNLPSGGGSPVAYDRPPTPNQADIREASENRSDIKVLRDLADRADAMEQTQSAAGRGWLGLRGFVQGYAPWETLSPDEQKYVTAFGRVRMMADKAMMGGGVGGFRSKQMIDQLNKIAGGYWQPHVGIRLRELADAGEASLGELGATTRETRRQDLSGGAQPIPGTANTPHPRSSGMKAGSPATAGASGSSAPVKPNPGAAMSFREWAQQSKR